MYCLLQNTACIFKAFNLVFNLPFFIAMALSEVKLKLVDLFFKLSHVFSELSYAILLKELHESGLLLLVEHRSGRG